MSAESVVSDSVVSESVADSDDNRRAPWSPRWLIVAAAIAVSVGVLVFAGPVFLAIHVTVCLLGWLLWRYGHAYLGGLFPALLGADALLCSAYDWALRGSEDFHGLRVELNAAACLLLSLGLGVFVWVAAQKPAHWKNQLTLALALLAFGVVWWAVVPTLGTTAINRRRDADMAANRTATEKAVVLVEELRKTLGRAPDASELTRLLAEPIPAIRWDGRTRPIRYRRVRDDEYQMSYVGSSIFAGDIMVYESSTPHQGWYRVPF